ncbi:MAG: hypothetical protein ACT4OT_13090 [Acidobacteriota bacterium]
MDRRGQEKTVETFLRWGTPVTIDVKAKMLRELPLAQPESLVEIPVPERPTEEALEARCASY